MLFSIIEFCYIQLDSLQHPIIIDNGTFAWNKYDEPVLEGYVNTFRWVANIGVGWNRKLVKGGVELLQPIPPDAYGFAKR